MDLLEQGFVVTGAEQSRNFFILDKRKSNSYPQKTRVGDIRIARNLIPSEAGST